MWRAFRVSAAALARAPGTILAKSTSPQRFCAVRGALAIICLLSSFGSLGCRELYEPSPQHQTPVAEPNAVDSDPLLYSSRALSFRIRSALQRLDEPMPAVTRFKKQACPDAEIAARSTGHAARELVLTTQDSRYEARSLMPLRLTRQLQSDPERRVLEFFEPDAAHTAFVASLDKRLKSLEHARAAEQVVAELEQQTFKGVFHIVQFKKPHLIRKKGKLKREWTRGLLQAWLVIYDIDSSEALCQVDVTTLNDVSDEPLSIRLRAETQRRLVRDLGRQLRQETHAALASISHSLTLPAADERPAARAAQRVVRLDQPPGMQ